MILITQEASERRWREEEGGELERKGEEKGPTLCQFGPCSMLSSLNLNQ